MMTCESFESPCTSPDTGMGAEGQFHHVRPGTDLLSSLVARRLRVLQKCQPQVQGTKHD